LHKTNIGQGYISDPEKVNNRSLKKIADMLKAVTPVFSSAMLSTRVCGTWPARRGQLERHQEFLRAEPLRGAWVEVSCSSLRSLLSGIP
jgi:hypothetical protein